MPHFIFIPTFPLTPVKIPNQDEHKVQYSTSAQFESRGKQKPVYVQLV